MSREKHLIGVPVLPGFAPVSGSFALDLDDSSSDAASTGGEIESVQLRGASSVSSVPGALARSSVIGHQRFKLRHVDFMPRLVKNKTMSDDEYEHFPILWRRGNAWLQEHPYALLFSCETVTWMSMDKPIFSDNGLLNKSMTTDKKTRFLRGLRLWYFTADEVFYEQKNLPAACKFGYMNYVPDGKSDTLGNMLVRLNEDLRRKPVAGIILRVESLQCNHEVGDADVSCWWEQPSKDRTYYTFFRIYFTEFPEVRQQYGDLVIKDFVPANDQRTIHSGGYEVYSELFKKAARWIYTHPHCQCVNIQSVYVKLKKDASDSEMVDRVYHTEHGSAHSALTATRTEYIQIARLVYCKPQREAPEHGLRMSYKTFYPTRLRKENDIDPETLEAAYEDLTQTEERLNSWMAFSGARMVGVETIPVRLKTGGQDTFGAEATCVFNGREKNFQKEYWRNNIRIYLEGDYREVPSAWSKPYNDLGNMPPVKE